MSSKSIGDAQPMSDGGATNCVIFFDIGNTLASPRISPAGALIGLDPDPAVFSVLDRLRERGFRLGIISNTPNSETNETMRAALTACGLYPFFDLDLLIYSSTAPATDPNTGEPIKAKPDPSIFRYAAGLAEVADCIFVGEDAQERAGAIAAKMRVAPSPLLVEDVLEGVPLRYLQIGPSEVAGDSWRSELLSLSLVTLGILADKVLAIASAKTAALLDDAGYGVVRLGAPDAPAMTDLYLLRDDARVPPESGFTSSKEGSSARFFGSTLPLEARHGAGSDEFSANTNGSEPWNWVLASDQSGLLVAIPAGQSIEEFHFTGAKHGHTQKLIASPHRLKSFEAAAGFGAIAAAAARELRSDEIDLLEMLDSDHLRRNLDRFVGLADLGDGSGPIRSRHIKHPDNRRAVQALAAEFERLGLETRLHRFSHEGAALDNIEAELAGESDEIVMITAHLDSTAAEGEGIFRPSQDAAPGADDDGSGIAATVSLAQLLAQRVRTGQLTRTIRFVLFNAEEQGLVGSQFYASEVADRGDRIVGVFQMDMIGYAGENRTPPRPFEIHIGHASDVMTTASRPLAELIRRFQPVVATDLLPPQIYDNTHPHSGDPAAGRSDHASFHDHGYPACVLSEDFFVGPDSTSPTPQDNPNYHKPSDTSVEYSYAAQITRCIGAAVLVMSDLGNEIPSSDQTHFQGAGSMPSYLNIDVAREARRNSPYAGAGQTTFIAGNLKGVPELKGTAPPVVAGTNLLTGTSRKVVLTQPAGFGIPEDNSCPGRISQALALVRCIDASAKLESARKVASYLSDGIQVADQTGACEFYADSTVQQNGGGDQFVYLNQHYRGIPVFMMARTVRFGSKAANVEMTGDHVPYIDPSLDIRPAVLAADAVVMAVKYIAEHQSEDDTPDEYGQLVPASQIDAGSFTPVVHARFNLPSQPTIYESRGLGATVPVSLVVYMSDVDRPRLAWDIIVTLPKGERQYRVLVPADALDEQKFYVRKVSGSASKPSPKKTDGSDWATDVAVAAATAGASPSLPAATTAPPMAAATAAVSGLAYFPSPASGVPQANDFPLPVSKYPLGVSAPPIGLGTSWVDANQLFAVGPNAIAVKGFGSPANPNFLLKGKQTAGKLTFNATDAFGNEQQLANIFFFCNYMHDFFYLLGFDVAAGNFEGDDGVIARAHPVPVSGTANMLTHPDHQRPLMNMGLVSGVNRHTAFDADVVFHEYTHGVTNRLVGGPMNAQALEADQSASMGEGWSDYFALTIQNYFRPADQERTTTGDWVVNQPGIGIRNAPYDDLYPFNFGEMASNGGLQEVHNAGEIWCACLMHMNRKITTALGGDRARAYRECWQIVVDSLKVCPANPSFIDARDAILTALEGRQAAGALNAGDFQACRTAAWTAFAGFGMGAQAPNNGSDFADAEDDFHLPDDLGGAEVHRPRNAPSLKAAALASGTAARKDRAGSNDYRELIAMFSKLSERDKGRVLAALEKI